MPTTTRYFVEGDIRVRRVHHKQFAEEEAASRGGIDAHKARILRLRNGVGLQRVARRRYGWHRRRAKGERCHRGGGECARSDLRAVGREELHGARASRDLRRQATIHAIDEVRAGDNGWQAARVAGRRREDDLVVVRHGCARSRRDSACTAQRVCNEIAARPCRCAGRHRSARAGGDSSNVATELVEHEELGER